MTCTKLDLGHDPRNRASYVAHWIEILENDPNEVFRAAKDANDITGYLLEMVQERELRPELNETLRDRGLENSLSL